MSISTYDDLAARIAEWLARSDLTSRIPEFIQLAEAKFRRKLAIGQQETRVTAATVGGEEYVSPPDDFHHARSLVCDYGDRRRALDFVTPTVFETRNPNEESGEPQYFTVEGGLLRVGPTPDGVYTLRLTYIAEIPALTADNQTNWLIEKYPDVYLYGSLVHAEGFLRKEAPMVLWRGLMDEGLAELEADDQKRRWNSGSIQMQPEPRTVV